MTLPFEILGQFCPEMPSSCRGSHSVLCKEWLTAQLDSSGPSEQPLVLSCSHEGPVWQVAWAHPMYGNILASCSYDRKVIIWKEENGTWEKTHEHTGHDSSGTLRGRRGRRGALGWERPLSWLTLCFPSPCDASSLSLGLWLAFLLVCPRGGKALRPKASPKPNEKSKDSTVLVSCFLRLFVLNIGLYSDYYQTSPW